MSLFICAHGMLTCRCFYCSDFYQEEQERPDDYENDKDDEVPLSKIIRSIKKEKIEY